MREWVVDPGRQGDCTTPFEGLWEKSITNSCLFWSANTFSWHCIGISINQSHIGSPRTFMPSRFFQTDQRWKPRLGRIKQKWNSCAFVPLLLCLRNLQRGLARYCSLWWKDCLHAFQSHLARVNSPKITFHFVSAQSLLGRCRLCLDALHLMLGPKSEREQSDVSVSVFVFVFVFVSLFVFEFVFGKTVWTHYTV